MNHHLSPRISSSQEVAGLTDAELKDLNACLLEDVLHLRERLIARGELYKLSPGNKALKHLQKARLWVTQELQSRTAKQQDSTVSRKAEVKQRTQEAVALQKLASAQMQKQAKEHRQAQLRLQLEIQKEANAAKLAKIKEANDQNLREVGVFKVVCREVVGDELYAYLWEEVKRRMEAAA